MNMKRLGSHRILCHLISQSKFFQNELYSVVSIKQTGGNRCTGWADFFYLLHENRVHCGPKIFLLKILN